MDVAEVAAAGAVRSGRTWGTLPASATPPVGESRVRRLMLTAEHTDRFGSNPRREADTAATASATCGGAHIMGS
ncbi:Uncharacterised protein [Mycobacteroides abscessus subsp. abscessus]|nr:Uncharacterised protein [Mycobacteroides abscessus subsp. abscessus]